MQTLISLLSMLAAIAPALAAPTATGPDCSQFSPVQDGPYTVNPDQWGESSGSGSQCAQINNLNGNSLSWSTTWSWANNPDNVKTYANAESSKTPCKQLKQIKTMPTTWDWNYSVNSGLRADVSYDAFLGSQCGGAHQIEVMVWLAAFGGLGPISASGSPISTPTIGSNHFKLYEGHSSDAGTTTYSFVADHEINHYSENLMAFFNHLVEYHGVSDSLVLQEVHAGTEAVDGQGAKFTTTGYTINSS